MFPFIHFCKNNIKIELYSISFSKGFLHFDFDGLYASISGDITINKYPEEYYNSENYLNSNCNFLLSTIGLNLLKIKEFDKSDKYPDGCMIFYFENDIELVVEFSPHYESCVLTFNEGEDKGVWVF